MVDPGEVGLCVVGSSVGPVGGSVVGVGVVIVGVGTGCIDEEWVGGTEELSPGDIELVIELVGIPGKFELCEGMGTTEVLVDCACDS